MKTINNSITSSPGNTILQKKASPNRFVLSNLNIPLLTKNSETAFDKTSVATSYKDFVIGEKIKVAILSGQVINPFAFKTDITYLSSKVKLPKKSDLKTDTIIISGILDLELFSSLIDYYSTFNKSRVEAHTISVIDNQSLHSQETEARSEMLYFKIKRFKTTLPIFSTFDNGNIKVLLNPKDDNLFINLSYEEVVCNKNNRLYIQKSYKIRESILRSRNTNSQAVSASKHPSSFSKECSGLESAAAASGGGSYLDQLFKGSIVETSEEDEPSISISSTKAEVLHK